ncbi:Hsp20/alpha crystallin family protein [Methanoregula sp.]|uniref:Hsp20/alpha crystallin family protein n=1 Tax=Methanoregula sp. TaxID=2052170 RepID=UPI0025FAC6A5|nr:Hsp20/alpha crystallin family protein [Methanoregula sp.]
MKGDPMDMFDQMDEMFARLFSQMSRDMSTSGSKMYGYHIVIDNGNGPGDVTEFQPALPRSTGEPVAEVHHIGNETMVIAELPGITGDSVRLDLKGTTLVIDAGDADIHYHTTAEVVGVDPATMKRSLKNGVLEVTFGNLPENEKGTGAPGK